MSKRASSSYTKPPTKRKRLKGTATFHSAGSTNVFPPAFNLVCLPITSSSSSSSTLPIPPLSAATSGPGDPRFSWKDFGDGLRRSRGNGSEILPQVKEEQGLDEVPLLGLTELGKQAAEGKEGTKQMKKKRSVQS
ncbi:hypothetical protein V5O48_018576, partial [Marasmius crinis-equi]